MFHLENVFVLNSGIEFLTDIAFYVKFLDFYRNESKSFEEYCDYILKNFLRVAGGI